MNRIKKPWEAIVVGGGIAGLSAAIYLGRARRRVLVIDSGRSLAEWEPDVENYLGFPEGIAGGELLTRARRQAKKYGTVFARDEIDHASLADDVFFLRSRRKTYCARRVLLATGLFHLPPEIPKVRECLGRSMFFCKDCDGHRVQGKRIAIIGRNNEAVEYALGMLLYSPAVLIATNGRRPHWDRLHQSWIREYEIPVFAQKISKVDSCDGKLSCLFFGKGKRVEMDAIFTTRGDVYHNRIAKSLGAKVDADGQIIVDHCLRTSVRGLSAAGCVTPANCQMIIAAGQGATAAQAINRDLFEESLRNHELRTFRRKQIETGQRTQAFRIDARRNRNREVQVRPRA